MHQCQHLLSSGYHSNINKYDLLNPNHEKWHVTLKNRLGKLWFQFEPWGATCKIQVFSTAMEKSWMIIHIDFFLGSTSPLLLWSNYAPFNIEWCQKKEGEKREFGALLTFLVKSSPLLLFPDMTEIIGNRQCRSSTLPKWVWTVMSLFSINAFYLDFFLSPSMFYWDFQQLWLTCRVS